MGSGYHSSGPKFSALVISAWLTLALLLPTAALAWDEEAALNHSQEAIGQPIADVTLVRRDGSRMPLNSLRGKPLVVSMIFTSCHHVCPTTTKRLEQAVADAREVLGEGSFHVLTIGFDTTNDSSRAMAAFARKQGVNANDWNFLSGSRENIEALSQSLGFVFFPSPRGFDHITQLSVIDRDGVLYRQVYGMQFELPWLVEPLKELVFDRRSDSHGLMAGLFDRIRLFCTTYDPASDRYHFDYSLFVQMGIGLAAILAVMMFLLRGMRRRA